MQCSSVSVHLTSGKKVVRLLTEIHSQDLCGACTIFRQKDLSEDPYLGKSFFLTSRRDCNSVNKVENYFKCADISVVCKRKSKGESELYGSSRPIACIFYPPHPSKPDSYFIGKFDF